MAQDVVIGGGGVIGTVRETGGRHSATFASVRNSRAINGSRGTTQTLVSGREEALFRPFFSFCRLLRAEQKILHVSQAAEPTKEPLRLGGVMGAACHPA